MEMNHEKGKRPGSNLNQHNIVVGEMRNSNESEDEIELGAKDAQREGGESYIIDDMEVAEVMNMTFQNEDDAYDFYNAYGKVAGFSVRKADVKKNADCTTKYRKMVCSREGRRDKKCNERDYRKRQPRPETRVGCPACLRIKYDKNKEKYMVTDFVKEHNHKMASKECVTYLRSHRKVTDADYAQASAMRMAGVKISQIMKFLAIQCGGYRNVGFSLKDLYNRIDLEGRKEIDEGDAESAIAYFTGRKDTDPTFYFEYDIDCEGRLNNLFWADAQSRVDYKYFGDVLVFDSTYNTNEYHKPLVVLAGVNNHFGTIVFGSAPVSYESIEAYEWVINALVNAMDGKRPMSVLTDGDKSMRRAIENVLPEAKHRLCSWHLAKNAEVNSKKCYPFMQMFGKFMKKASTIEEFEEEWHAVVSSCGLDGNEWVKKTYRRRYLWAEPLLKDSFFAGMRSTQRCENMNAFLKRYVKPTMNVYEFVKIHAFALDYLREKEVDALHVTEDTFLPLSTELHALERHATEIYTRKVFLFVKKHLSRQGLYDCFNREETRTGCIIYLAKYRDSRTWMVEINRGTHEMKCSCKKMEWKGLPCAHMFRVMLMENMQRIPQSCVLKRWSRYAKEDGDNITNDRADGIYDELLQTARYGSLMTDCKELCFYSSHMTDGFTSVRTVIHNETTKWRKLYTQRGIGQLKHGDQRQRSRVERQLVGVRDPVRTRAKGDHINTERNKRIQCGKCGLRDGHNARTCQNAGSNQALSLSQRVENTNKNGFYEGMGVQTGSSYGQCSSQPTEVRKEHGLQDNHFGWPVSLPCTPQCSNLRCNDSVRGHGVSFQELEAYRLGSGGRGQSEGLQNEYEGSQQNSNAFYPWF